MDEWTTVVAPAPREVALARFEAWKTAHPELARHLRPEHLRIDVMRVVGGKTFYRYLVRRLGD